MIVHWQYLLFILFLVQTIDARKHSILKTNLRLSGDQIPIRYELVLKVPVQGFVENFDYTTSGRVTIQLENKKEGADVIELHSLFHNVHGAALRSFDNHNSVDKITEVKKDSSRQTLLFTVNSLPRGIYELEIDYEGVISEDGYGLYQTGYRDKDFKWKFALTTQGEPTYIRRVVPCFDEPEMKATWQVTIIHPKGTRALSNVMSVHEQDYEGDPLYTRTTFGDTPKMASYLLALLVSEFSEIRMPSKVGTTVGVVYPETHSLESVSRSLQLAADTLDNLTSIFQVPYTLTKIDHLAIPDFNAGAMENWGLVTYRESKLTEGNATYMLPRSLRTICHETVHMWFGDLTTAKWWTDLWLHEGFAALYEDIVHVESDLPFNEVAVAGVHLTILRDRYLSNRPMHDETIETPSDITSHFDYVSYDKSARVLNMFRHLLGNEKWYAGLQRYLLAMQFKSSSADDFFHHVAGPYTDAFRSFTYQNGFPIVHVRRTDSGVALRASKYSILRFNGREIPSTFIVPVFYTINHIPTYMNTTALRTVLINGEDEVTVQMGKDDVIHVDPLHLGYYMVIYDIDMYPTYLSPNAKLAKHEKARIINDLTTALCDGYFDFAKIFAILGNKERDLVLTAPDLGLSTQFDRIHLRDEFEEILTKLKKHQKRASNDEHHHDEKNLFMDSSYSSIGLMVPVGKVASNNVETSIKTQSGDESHDPKCTMIKHNGFDDFMRMMESASREDEYNEIHAAIQNCQQFMSGDDYRKLLLAYLDNTNYNFRGQDLSTFLNKTKRIPQAKDVFLQVLFDEVLPNYEKRYQYNMGLVVNFLSFFDPVNEYHIQKMLELRNQYPQVEEDNAVAVKLFFEAAQQMQAWTTKQAPRVLAALRKITESPA